MRTLIALPVGLLLLIMAASSAPAFECKKNAECEDGDPCTVDRCVRPEKVCRHAAVINGTACNDGNACTRGDVCQAGACVGAPAVCTATDQCHVAGTCDPASGLCSNPPAPDGVGCNDRDLCTQTDTCQGGSCVGTNPIECTAIDECHLVGTCKPSTGFCSNPPKNPLVCTPVDQCNVAGTCDPTTGACTTPNKPDGVACVDGDACTQTDTCESGSCVGADPVVCEDPGMCRVGGACDPVTGECPTTPAPDGSACSGSGVACSMPDACQAGSCRPGGGGDTDGDAICDADDSCPAAADVAQADLDRDGVGDVCDTEDAPLVLARVLVRKSLGRSGANGGIRARGSFSTPAPDSFDAATGIAARVADARGLDALVTWDPAECTTSSRGRIRCRKGDDPSTQAKFRPRPRTPGLVKFSLRLSHLSVGGPFGSPVVVSITGNAMIDRVGRTEACQESAGRMTCGAR